MKPRPTADSSVPRQKQCAQSAQLMVVLYTCSFVPSGPILLGANPLFLTNILLPQSGQGPIFFG